MCPEQRDLLPASRHRQAAPGSARQHLLLLLLLLLLLPTCSTSGSRGVHCLALASAHIRSPTCGAAARL
jgi:hypothetical protein